MVIHNSDLKPDRPISARTFVTLPYCLWTKKVLYTNSLIVFLIAHQRAYACRSRYCFTNSVCSSHFL